MTCQWNTNFEKGLTALSNIVQMIVTEPTRIERFPHPTAVRRLKFNNIPNSCDDWEWFDALQTLEDVDVSVKGSQGDAGRLYVKGNTAKWTNINGDDVVPTLVRAFENLPRNIRKRVKFILMKTTLI